MKALEDKIATAIAENGPMNFENFMRMALYDPELGYYCSDREKLGWKGDFFTSCTLTPAFGHALARQILDMHANTHEPDLHIVEYGAGTGQLAEAVLDYVRRERPDLRCVYHIIEISPSLVEVQKKRLGSGVIWHNNITELSGFKGIVICNELLDNFPFRRVRMGEELEELLVEHGERGFTELWVPASAESIEHLKLLHISLPRGYHLEICLEAEKWLEEISTSMSAGYLLTIDYGYLAGDLTNPARIHGTAASYKEHRVVPDLLANAGEQDITAHVNFSAIALYARGNGFELAGFREQASFLRALGIEKLVQPLHKGTEVRASLKEESVLNTLLGTMGSKFKVLALRKGLPASPLLGFS